MSSVNPYSPSAQPVAKYNALASSRTLRVKTVEPLSMGKMLGALYVLLGAIIAVFMGIFAFVGAVSGGNGTATAAVPAVGMMIFMPLIYGLIGFMGGVILALLYNLVARFVGGVEFEVEG